MTAGTLRRGKCDLGGRNIKSAGQESAVGGGGRARRWVKGGGGEGAKRDRGMEEGGGGRGMEKGEEGRGTEEWKKGESEEGWRKKRVKRDRGIEE